MFHKVALISVFFVISFCAVETLSQDIRKCFLYPVTEKEPSPMYDLSYSNGTLLTIIHLFRENTVTRIMDGNNQCILGIGFENRDKRSGCRNELTVVSEYATLVFQRQGHEFLVYQKDVVDPIIQSSLSSFRVETNARIAINVVFDCHNNCYTFETAIIHKHYKDIKNPSSLRIYGKKIDENEGVNTTVKLLRGLTGDHKWTQYYYLHGSWQNMDMLNSNRWYHFDFTVDIKETSTIGYYQLVLYGEYHTDGYKPILLTSQGYAAVVSPDLYLDFGLNKNIIWSVFCEPQEMTVYKGDGCTRQGLSGYNKTRYFYIALINSGVLLIIVGIACCCFYRHFKKKEKLSAGSGVM